MSKDDKEQVKKYYDQEYLDYIAMYKDGYKEYPSNLIRFNFVNKRLKENKITTILDVGCGACSPMILLLNGGFKVKGFDFSEEMVEEGKNELEKAGYDSNLICHHDFEDDLSIFNEKFDAMLALGVFPHLLNEKQALLNMKEALVEKGVVFISFRNELFAAYTLNKYSFDFYMKNLINLSSFPENIKEDVIDFFIERLKIEAPQKKEGEKIYYTDILAKFHNPLNIDSELFRPNGFRVEKIHFYHYHALPPIFDIKYPDLFRELSLKMENPNDWRGYLMASAFVVEARKQ